MLTIIPKKLFIQYSTRRLTCTIRNPYGTDANTLSIQSRNNFFPYRFVHFLPPNTDQQRVFSISIMSTIADLGKSASVLTDYRNISWFGVGIRFWNILLYVQVENVLLWVRCRLGVFADVLTRNLVLDYSKWAHVVVHRSTILPFGRPLGASSII